MLCHRQFRYLAANWLKLLIIAATGLALLSAYLGRFPAVHLLHLAYIGLLFIWLLGRIRRAFSGNVIPYALLLGAGTILAAGIGFFLFEPTVRTYGEGIWLAFTTAATIGYGDYVPTTVISRTLAVAVVVVGYAVFSLVTAGIAALFVGAEEKQAQDELHSDIRSLRGEVRQLRRDLAAATPIRKCGSARGRGIRMTRDTSKAPHIERWRKTHSLKKKKVQSCIHVSIGTRRRC
ncbi:two pore domain potassium channel family protein (plasmid) [Burkholderia thailandensis]|nr:two pore domain potassium channel family protein [Burkholderia thailandensis]QRA15389.1 two pore domain potassium channel family protein [Burkholderia thailandensis]